jgi:tetratricopeptide (TPR) repeat protein
VQCSADETDRTTTMSCTGKSEGGGKGNADDVPECGNDGCAKKGLLRCARCKSVMYCSAACQKVHWKQGGHKHACSPAHSAATPSPSSSAAAATAACSGAAVGGSGACEGSCIICLNEDPPGPIQSGCACRGDAGLAHVECRAEAASHRMTSTKDWTTWWECGTCKQRFTGAMATGLAEAWWSRVMHLPEENEERLGAASNLGDALKEQGKHAEAETIRQEIFAVYLRLVGFEHPFTLGSAANLAMALSELGKYDEAEAVNRTVLAVQRRINGAEHPDTLMTASNLAVALERQRKYAEAEAMYREVLAIRRRVLGPEHADTLTTASNLAPALSGQRKFVEAETLLRELLVIQQRVLGRAHPDTMIATVNLAITLACQGKHADAVPLLRGTLALQQQVLGPEHPDTVNAMKTLELCLRVARGNANSAK